MENADPHNFLSGEWMQDTQRPGWRMRPVIQPVGYNGFLFENEKGVSPNYIAPPIFGAKFALVREEEPFRLLFTIEAHHKDVPWGAPVQLAGVIDLVSCALEYSLQAGAGKREASFSGVRDYIDSIANEFASRIIQGIAGAINKRTK